MADGTAGRGAPQRHGAPAGRPAPAATADDVAIVVVTFNRADLLGGLLASIAAADERPGRVVVVDNASSDHTPDVLAAARDRLGDVLLVRRLETNTGGAGGFCEGVRTALEDGARWLWLMDDDVEVLPDGMARLLSWSGAFRVLHGRRWDHDGSPFFWQPEFNQLLGVPKIVGAPRFEPLGWSPASSGCFEGMFVHRSVVERIGLPDPRFFIGWDDAIYGWLASRATRSAVVDEFVLRRARDIRQLSIGTRQLNAGGDLTRYHIMRNRAHIARYFAAHGELFPAGFAVGTAFIFAKELVRLVVVERKVRGAGRLVRGWLDGRAVRRDPSWRPMPPFVPAAAAAEAGGAVTSTP
ncbi:glycosyltransferase family 2 protein [Kineococcus glutinatus]|uniref:Glycosyltransferase family 2 protein n=2 Tax=Kineococcus glutinatus TaxID=1070872 RepID=A0ABP9HAA3_9ACTN